MKVKGKIKQGKADKGLERWACIYNFKHPSNYEIDFIGFDQISAESVSGIRQMKNH